MNFLFFITSAFGFISFFVLAQKWPEIMKCWEIMELNLTSFHNYRLKRARMIKLRVVAFSLIFLAIGNYLITFHLKVTRPESISRNNFSLISVEHSLSICSTVQTITETDESLITIMVNIMVPFLYEIVNQLPPWVAAPFFFISGCATFMWNFLDLFVMVISIGLSTLFELLNYEIEHTRIEVERKRKCGVRVNILAGR